MSMFTRVNKAFKARRRYIEKTFAHGDLTAAATSESLDLGSLPPGAVPDGVEVELATPFTGGTVSACVVAVGTTADPDAILASANVFAAAADGQASAQTQGAAPRKRFASGAALKALFTATGDNVVNLSAGACTIRVYYSTPELG